MLSYISVIGILFNQGYVFSLTSKKDSLLFPVLTINTLERGLLAGYAPVDAMGLEIKSSMKRKTAE